MADIPDKLVILDNPDRTADATCPARESEEEEEEAEKEEEEEEPAP